MIRLRYIVIAFGFILLILYLAGGAMNHQCTAIGACSACWRTTPIMIKSEMCPDPTNECLAQPAQQQHNALVDMLICACTKAKAENYQVQETKGAVESAVKEMLGYTLSAEQLCEDPASVLVRQQYG
jgi:hypothetical protein